MTAAVLQAGLLNVRVTTFGFWALDIVILLALAGVVVALATDDRDPSTVLAWLFVILLIPVLGLVAYFFIGRNFRRDSKRRQKASQQMRDVEKTSLTPVMAATTSFTEAAVAALAGTPGQRIESTGRVECTAVPLPADTVDVYFTGAEKFAALLDDLAAAQRYIHLMYLIWEQDELTAKVTDVLLDRLGAGVEVHILYDWLSCISYKKDELKRLAAAGATVAPCYKRLPQFNYRNHMKMAIVDGAVVYSGGMNMGQEYIDGGPRFDVWRDTHFRMTGPVVAPYLMLYAATWLFNGGTEDLATGYMPPPVEHGGGEGIPVQVLYSSVETTFKTIRDVFITALTNARRRVWVQSPYFVPDEPLMTAMCTAAASGVDVRLMMAGVPDKKIPFYAAQAYYPQLLRAGVKIYQYRAGFLHAKTVTVDDQLALIGTCNWDIRSLILHDEVTSVFYDEGIASRAAERYARDIEDCVEVTPAGLASLGRRQTFRNSVYRLFSRLL